MSESVYKRVLLKLGGESLALAIGLTTLVPLILLMISGLYLFALPYLGGRRGQAAE